MANSQLIYKNAGNGPLLALLPRCTGRILDCGCGAGDNARILMHLGWRVSGVTKDVREQVAALPFCDDVYLADLEHGLPDDIPADFDVVLMSHVLEHLAAPERLLDDARRLLPDEGLIAVAIPNVLHYRQRLRFLRGEFTYTETGILDRSHLRFYTYASARQLLTDLGYDIVHSVPDGSMPWWRLRHVIPSSLRGSIDHWVCARMPDLFAHQGLFLARKSQAYASPRPTERPYERPKAASAPEHR